MAENNRKTALVAELASSRGRITENLRTVRRDLEFSRRLRSSFARRPAVWIGAAVVMGLIISRPFGRQPKPAPRGKKREAELEKAGKAGLALGGLKIVFDLAKPFLMTWVKRRIASGFGAEKHPGAFPR